MKLKLIPIWVCIFASPILGQVDSIYLSADEIQMLVNRLGVKLLLNDSQKSEIIKTLTEYSLEVSSHRSDNTFTEEVGKDLIAGKSRKIKTLFDEKQKIKFGIIEKEWWEGIKTEGND